MKILIISHEFPPVGGGGGNACYFLTREFVRRGDEVAVITPAFGELPLRETVNGAEIYRIHSGREHLEYTNFKEMLSYLLMAGKLAFSMCEKEKFDVCLAFFGIPSGPVAYCLKRKFRLPYLIRFGGGDVPGFQARYRLMYRVLGPAIRGIWRGAGALVVNSGGLRKMARAYYDRVAFQVIPNGVDTGLFCPGTREKGERLRILFVSRLIERKGLQVILRDWDRISEACGREIELRVVGDGPYRETLERIAGAQRHGGSIMFLGQKSRQELPAIYRDADLFVLPSEKEGMPNVVLEAMASGLPILMTPCSGAEELVDGNGMIAPQDRFADALIEMIRMDERRAAMAEKSRERAAGLFGWQNIADRYRQIMETLSAGAKPAAES